MPDSTCPNCGSSLRADSAFCPKCGKPASSVAPAAAAAPTAPLRRSRRNLWAAIAVVIVVVAAAIAVLAYEYEPGKLLNPYRVKVAQVVWTQDNGSVSLTTTPGFSVLAGKNAQLYVTLFCAPGSFFGPYSVNCSSGSVYILTPGFGVVATNAPFEWASGTSGVSETVGIIVSTPTGANFNGDLAIDLH
jgi:hypothetical protein